LGGDFFFLNSGAPPKGPEPFVPGEYRTITKDPTKIVNYIWIPGICRKDPTEKSRKAIKSFLFPSEELGNQLVTAMAGDGDRTTCLQSE
jgi:hypothetical protein